MTPSLLTFWIGCYILIGLTIYLFAPRPPKAQEAFEIAERSHPAGRLMCALLVSLLWPLILPSVIRMIFK